MLQVIESYFSVLMLFGASQAVTGLYLLLKDKRRPFANNMLGLLCLSWGFSCYWFFAFIHREPFFSQGVTTFIGPMLPLTLFPPIYLYVKYLFYEFNKLNRRDHLHFLPVYLYIIFTLYLFISQGGTVAGMREHPWYHARTMVCSYIAMLQGPYYYFRTNQILKLRQIKLKQEYSEIESQKLEWLSNINLGFALVFIIGGISTIIRTTHLNPYILYMSYHAVISISLFYITLVIFRYPFLFASPPLVQEMMGEQTANSIHTGVKNIPQSTLNTNILHASKEDELIEKLNEVMKNQKLFRNPNFNLNDLANSISETRNSISFLLNNRLNNTFYDYINELRVEESKRLLSDKKLNHYTIEAIATEAGFKTMSVFYRLFKNTVKSRPPNTGNRSDDSPECLPAAALFLNLSLWDQKENHYLHRRPDSDYFAILTDKKSELKTTTNRFQSFTHTN